MSENGYIPQDVRSRTERAIKSRGLRRVVGDYARWGAGVVTGLPFARAGSHGTFAFGGESYSYLYHPYKFAWLTERAVEVPIARAIIEAHRGKRILEVGHVLGHYLEGQDHVVVDKYEEAPGVLNRDATELDDLGPVDLVMAISTVEHVGWDENPREPEKAVDAVRALQRLLAPGGTLVLTVPVGYHPGLDAALASGELPVRRARAMRRERIGPHWREAAPESVWGAPYDFLLYSARAMVVAELGPAA